ANGGFISAEHVILTIGHIENKRSETSLTAPYTVLRELDATNKIAVYGAGLVATDIVMMLTQGRGGVFEKQNGRVSYLPSGREPTIYLVSRSGQPYRAKSTSISQVPDRTEPFLLNTEVIDRLRLRGSIDFNAEIMPLLYREMSVRYHLQALYEAGKSTEAKLWAGRIRRLHSLFDVDNAINTL